MKTNNLASRIYLDYAASTPIDPRVVESIMQAQSEFANPSAVYAEGRQAREAYQQAKKQVGMVIGVKADEVVFTSGATEADNLAILGAVRPHLGGSPSVVTLRTEHQSVLGPIAQLESEGAEVRYADLDKDGVVDLSQLEKLIGESTVLVSIAYASSEIGTIQPLAKVGSMIAKIKKSRVEKGSTTPLLLHSDCSAVVGSLALSPTRLSLDLMTINSSKIYGPHGCGVLFVRRGVDISPIMYGGSQQGGLRPGSEDLASAIGMAKALEIAEDMRSAEVDRLTDLRDQLLVGLKQLKPELLINGSTTSRLAGNVNVSIPPYNGEDLVAYFDAAGFAVSTGAACAAASEEPSHVLLAVGRTWQEAQSSIRISLGRQTTEGDVAKFIDAAQQIMARLDRIDS